MRPLEINLILGPPCARIPGSVCTYIDVRIIYSSYVGRVPDNIKRDVYPRRHSPKTEEEGYNGLKRETHDSAQTPNAHAHNQNLTLEMVRHERSAH